MKILAVGCHPDDVEIACAGTLAKCVMRGDEVTVCHVANGDLGHAVIQPPKLREMRAEEARKAGSLAGIKVITCDIGDVMVYEGSKEQRDKVVEVIRAEDPDFLNRNQRFVFFLSRNHLLSKFCLSWYPPVKVGESG